MKLTGEVKGAALTGEKSLMETPRLTFEEPELATGAVEDIYKKRGKESAEDGTTLIYALPL